MNFAPDNPIARLLEAPPIQQMAFQALDRGRGLNQSEINRFCEHGVEPINLFKPWSTQVDCVVFNGDCFEFVDDADGGGERVFTMGVIGNMGLIDVIAWQPSSGRQAMWLGAGFALGEFQIRDYVDNMSSGLAVYRTPMGWLRAGGEGIVIVRKTFTPIVLAKVPVLIAEDEVHRIALRKMFPSGGPRIVLCSLENPVPAAELEVAT